MRPADAPRRVVVLGPTASGKSAVAMHVASTLGDVDVVAIDAMQVYRRMDIGTAKPTAADRAAVRHYCLDLVEPSERFTATQFQAEASRALDQIQASGRRALLVGGTGLYLTAVVDELVFPGEWPEIRAELETNADTAGLYRRLAELDPPAAGKIEPNNRRRIVRALEVCLGSGERFSDAGPGTATFPDNGVVQVGIRWSRSELARRIAQRVDAMITDGLVDEVRQLLADDPPMSRTAAQALGYKEMIDHVEGRSSLSAARDEVVLRTVQFAVRQERWYRRDPRVRWIDVSDVDPVDAVSPAVLRAFGE
ncbi:MAG: tRNA (adenosine(37)-N6)-dimethylallyltransferase MiaA [Actinobacteria bacterium]|nr:tRNA (adenosine(37)-N6)-dimethylallyltransferase MiaA [Actinomycetota bacterium]